jgi:hypothetical protein
VPEVITGLTCSRGSLKIDAVKYGLESRRTHDPRDSSQMRANSNYKLQTHPLVREGAPYWNPRKCQHNFQGSERKRLSRVPDRGQTGRLTVGRKITFTWLWFIDLVGRPNKWGPSENWTDSITDQRNKLRGPQSASELYRLSDRHLSTKFSANFCEWRGVAWSARRIPYGRLLVTASVVPSSPILVTLMKEEQIFSERSVLTTAARHYIPEDVILQEIG